MIGKTTITKGRNKSNKRRKKEKRGEDKRDEDKVSFIFIANK